MHHFFDVLFPKSGMQDDRQVLKDKASSHQLYRSSSGDGNVTWMSRMQKSGHMAFQLLEAVGHEECNTCTYDDNIK